MENFRIAPLGAVGGGLTRYTEGRFRHYTKRDGLASDFVRCLLADRAGNLWIGTRGGGLNLFRDERFTTYTTKDGLPGDQVFAFYEDCAGSLWIGTSGGGLLRFKDGRLPPAAEINLYRIVQECLNNIVKHAAATEASVQLRRVSHRLHLTIHDNGRGFVIADRGLRNADAKSSGFGLTGLSERALLLHGTLHIDSSPGAGTRITFTMPLPNEGSFMSSAGDALKQ